MIRLRRLHPQIGDEWARSNDSLVLRVPTALPGESII